MFFGTNTVKAEDFTRQVKACHLLNTIVIKQVGLYRARAHSKNRSETIPGPVNMFSGLDRTTAFDNVINLVDILDVHRNG